jgi:glycerophosphoryl diester phosphodiesterase
MPLPEALEQALKTRGYLRSAHRGAPTFGIGNTDICILAALEHDPDLIEVDVHSSSDGHLILWHDDQIENAGEHLVIAKTPLRQLREIRFNDSSKIITLEEAMRLVKGKCGILVDLKANGLAQGIIAATRASQLETVVVCGGDFETFETIKRLEPKIAVSFTPDVVDLVFGSSRMNSPLLDAVTVHWLAVTPKFLKRFQARGVRVIAWTVDDPNMMRELIKRGANGITTNRIELLTNLELQRT